MVNDTGEWNVGEKSSITLVRWTLMLGGVSALDGISSRRLGGNLVRNRHTLPVEKKWNIVVSGWAVKGSWGKWIQ